MIAFAKLACRNDRVGSNPEVSQGRGNVCFRGESGSGFRATGSPFLAISPIDEFLHNVGNADYADLGKSVNLSHLLLKASGFFRDHIAGMLRRCRFDQNDAALLISDWIMHDTTRDDVQITRF